MCDMRRIVPRRIIPLSYQPGKGREIGQPKPEDDDSTIQGKYSVINT